MSTCARKFDHPSRTIRDQDGNTIISLDPKTIDRILWVPPTPLVTNISKQKPWKGGKKILPIASNMSMTTSRSTKGLTSWDGRKVYVIQNSRRASLYLAALEDSKDPTLWALDIHIHLSKCHIQIKEDILGRNDKWDPSWVVVQGHYHWNVYMNSYLVYNVADLGSFSALSTETWYVLVWDYHDQFPLRVSCMH